MKLRDEVLVAIIPQLLDMTIAREQHWYRIPVHSADKLLKKRWPPKWVAFYQPQIFGSEAFAVKYYARVQNIRKVYRWQLLPDEPENEKTYNPYYKLELSPLSCLPQPITSRRQSYTVFIQTTWEKLTNADEINDLYDESPLEDLLWAELKRLEIHAERQQLVKVKNKKYFLDFAIYCTNGKINVETDGDTWHGAKHQIILDNERDNDLVTKGWVKLRFNTHQIIEKMQEECIPAIAENINRLGGLAEGKIVSRTINPNSPEVQQLTLF